jgi:hypothetical protein
MQIVHPTEEIGLIYLVLLWMRSLGQSCIQCYMSRTSLKQAWGLPLGFVNKAKAGIGYWFPHTNVPSVCTWSLCHNGQAWTTWLAVCTRRECRLGSLNLCTGLRARGGVEGERLARLRQSQVKQRAERENFEIIQQIRLKGIRKVSSSPTFLLLHFFSTSCSPTAVKS